MKRITINVEESKYRTFLSFIKTLDYVSISDEDDFIPQWQQKEVDQRQQKVDNGQMGTRSWEEARKDIFKK